MARMGSGGDLCGSISFGRRLCNVPARGGINDEGTDDRYFDTTLARSRDGGRTWRSFALVPHAIVLPVMMSSNPGRLFTFNCEGPPGVPDLTRSEAVLRWSDDRGES